MTETRIDVKVEQVEQATGREEAPEHLPELRVALSRRRARGARCTSARSAATTSACPRGRGSRGSPTPARSPRRRPRSVRPTRSTSTTCGLTVERLAEAELNTGLGDAMVVGAGTARRLPARARGDGLLLHGRLDGERRRREVRPSLRRRDRRDLHSGRVRAAGARSHCGHLGAWPAPIVAGGTGFYLRALLDGLFEGPSRDQALRDRLAAREVRRRGSLHRLLRRFDSEAAAKIHPNDIPKVTRALEVCLLSRRPVTELYRQGRDRLRGYRALKLGLLPEREALNERIDARCRPCSRAGWRKRCEESWRWASRRSNPSSRWAINR